MQFKRTAPGNASPQPSSSKQGSPKWKRTTPELTKRISADLRKLRKDIPDTMQAFSALAQAATRDGALDKKTKELIALAIGVAGHCDGCIGFHTEALGQIRRHAPGSGGNSGHGCLYGRWPADVRRRCHLRL